MSLNFDSFIIIHLGEYLFKLSFLGGQIHRTWMSKSLPRILEVLGYFCNKLSTCFPLSSSPFEILLIHRLWTDLFVKLLMLNIYCFLDFVELFFHVFFFHRSLSFLQAGILNSFSGKLQNSISLRFITGKLLCSLVAPRFLD